MVLGWESVRPVAACTTCFFEGLIVSSNFAKKSIPSMGVATSASKKLKRKGWPLKRTAMLRKPQAGIVEPLAPIRCGPVDVVEDLNGKMESEAPESTKNFKLLAESCKKIRFLAGMKDTAVAVAGTDFWAVAGGGVPSDRRRLSRFPERMVLCSGGRWRRRCRDSSRPGLPVGRGGWRPAASPVPSSLLASVGAPWLGAPGR